MLKVYQDKTVGVDGFGNCFNACIASLLEIPIRECNEILPRQPGDWHQRWSVYLAEKNLKLRHWWIEDEEDTIPQGYSIASVQTSRIYPEDHPKAGNPIAHAVIMYNGQLVHDPFPLGSEITKILYYQTLENLSPMERKIHRLNSEDGICMHGYLSRCIVCNKPDLDD